MKTFTNNTLRASKGFSLVEVTLALGICAFCLISLVGLLPSGVSATANASRETTAAQIAASILADLQHIGPANQLDVNGNPELDGDNNPIIVFPTASTIYHFPFTSSAKITVANDTTGVTYASQFLNTVGGVEQWAAVATGGQYYVTVRVSPEPSPTYRGVYDFTVDVSWPPAATANSVKQGNVTVFGSSRRY